MYDIKKKKYLKAVSKSIMAAQKCKNLLTDFLGIFECLLTQNPTNQNSQENPETWDSRELFQLENNFKTCCNSRIWLKKQNL